MSSCGSTCNSPGAALTPALWLSLLRQEAAQTCGMLVANHTGLATASKLLAELLPHDLEISLKQQGALAEMAHKAVCHSTAALPALVSMTCF